MFIFHLLCLQPCDDQRLRCELGYPGTLWEAPCLWREWWGKREVLSFSCLCQETTKFIIPKVHPLWFHVCVCLVSSLVRRQPTPWKTVSVSLPASGRSWTRGKAASPRRLSLLRPRSLQVHDSTQSHHRFEYSQHSLNVATCISRTVCEKLECGVIRLVAKSRFESYHMSLLQTM